MSKHIINCAYCGDECGSWYPAQTYGDPNDCYPAEYDREPYCDDGGREFCDDSCCRKWHAENDDPPEEEDAT
jgi:hypothetical protein